MAQADSQPTTEGELTPDQRLKQHKAELSKSGIRGLEGRLQRGLDPMGMLSVREVRDRIMKLADVTGMDMEKLHELTTELHFGAIWGRAEELAKAESPEVRTWMMLAELTEEENAKDKDQEGYLKDVDRITGELESLAADPEQGLARIQEAVTDTVDHATDRFVMEDGVPYAETDAFLHMAIAGETAGVVKSGDLYFVGSNELDFATVAKEHGLKEEVRKDDYRGGVETTFYVGENGVEVKKLGPGFCIVFGGDKGLAKDLARTGMATKSEKE